MTKPQPITRRLLRLKDSASYLSESVRSLRARIQRGELPVIAEPNAPWRCDIRDLDEWILRRKETL